MTEDNNSIDDVRKLTATPSARRGLFVFCLNHFAAENYVAFMCIEKFSRERKKRQALMICQWFIDDDPPEELKNIITNINMNSSEIKKSKLEAVSIKAQVNSIGKTFKSKMTKHGGGLSGFMGALKQKTITGTKLTGNFFEDMQDNAAMNIMSTLDQEGVIDNPDEAAAPKPKFINQIIRLKRDLKVNGFDPDNMGIYA